MSDEQQFELLADIAKLLKKHGTTAFESLADNIAKPEFAKRLGAILSAVAKQGNSITRQPRVQEQTLRDFRKSLVETEAIEPDKLAVLIKFHDALVGKTILPTSGHIQWFLSETGLPVPTTKARDKNIVSIIKALIPLPLNEIRTLLAPLEHITTKDDRSLEGWSNLILNNKRQSAKTDEDDRSQMNKPQMS